MIHHRQRLLRRANLAAGGAQAFERLRLGHLVDQMAVDIEQAGTVIGFVNQMIVPDLVVQRGRLGHERKPYKSICVNGRSADTRETVELRRGIRPRAQAPMSPRS